MRTIQLRVLVAIICTLAMFAAIGVGLMEPSGSVHRDFFFGVALLAALSGWVLSR